MRKKFQKRNLKQHVAPKLRRRLKIFVAIISIIFTISIYNIVAGDLSILLALIALCSGGLIGFIAGRMFKIFWHPQTKQVVSRLDKIGIIFLAFYIAIEASKRWFLGHWLQGKQLNAFSLIFIGGLLLGRLLAMLTSIKKVLIKENKW